MAAELVTSRGPITSERGAKVLALARDLAADPRIDVLSITDNPGGHAMLSPDALGTDLISRGQEVIIHLACKDWNRNALESRGWQLSSGGFHNVLALSGDYPVVGHRGLAAPVFDIDSVGLISLFSEMNAGLPDERRPDTRLQRTDFFMGGVVTNHKRHEREVMPQYFKLRKKARAGARFVINQAGWNTRKDDELLRWIRRDGLDLRVLANVYLLSRTAARAFHRGVIPGIVVTDELLALAERHAASPDNGRAFFVDLASKHLAVVRGLGYDGVYLGGHMPAETFGEIIDGAESYAADWRELAREIQFPRTGEFHFFERDPDTGLSSDVVSATYLESKRRRRTDLPVPVKYRFSRRLHDSVFARNAPLFETGRNRLSTHRQGATARAPRGPCPRAGGEGSAVLVQGLRRLLAPRDRLRLPGVAVREEPAQRPVRRHARRAVRGLRHGVHLVGGVRASQGVRRGGVDARRPRRGQGQRLARDERMGQHVPRTRPPGARRSRIFDSHRAERRYLDMSHKSLEDKLQAAGSAVEMARNSQIGPYVYPAVPAEFSNWREEQVAWRETSALFDQSHHMLDVQIEGPDTIRLLSHVGVNTFESFAPNKAKQLVVCNPDGYVIGDAILFHLEQNKVRLVGRPSAHNWLQYHAETGDFDVHVSRDERTAVNPTGGRELYRFQVQGPTAMQVLEAANGGPLPEIKFFNMGELTIGGRKVRALHHGMSGVPGLELWGPWAEREDVRGAIVEAGKGLRPSSGRLARVRDEHARVWLDPLPAARGLHG